MADTGHAVSVCLDISLHTACLEAIRSTAVGQACKLPKKEHDQEPIRKIRLSIYMGGRCAHIYNRGGTFSIAKLKRMKLTLAVGFIAAGLVAADCGVRYNVKPEPTCIADCNRKAGQGIWDEWTDDPTSPNFVKSLSYMCDKSSPKHIEFMMESGICMTKCSKEDQNIFREAYGQTCNFYQAYSKNPDCKSGRGINGVSSTARENTASSTASMTSSSKSTASGTSSPSSAHSNADHGKTASSTASSARATSGGTPTSAAAAQGAKADSQCSINYNVKPEPQCIADCNRKAGQSLWSQWTDDPSSPDFIKSLGYMCDKGTEDYMTFMTKGGECMVSCSKEDQKAFTDSYGQICDFYDAYTKQPACDNNKGVSDGSSSKKGKTGSGSGASHSTGQDGTSSRVKEEMDTLDEELHRAQVSLRKARKMVHSLIGWLSSKSGKE